MSRRWWRCAWPTPRRTSPSTPAPTAFRGARRWFATSRPRWPTRRAGTLFSSPRPTTAGWSE
ncbi:hypothetical protein NKG94_02040 [Micromonospora sp. M12]